VRAAIVTWQGGGATQPAIGLGRLLAERGHEVRVVAPAAYAERIATAGCAHRPYPPELEFDVARGRAAEDQAGYIEEVLLGLGPPQLLAEALAEQPADVVVVDYLMRSTLCRAEALGVPRVVLFHMLHRFHGAATGAMRNGDGAGSTGASTRCASASTWSRCRSAPIPAASR
jgi:UDP:flavonoid glycosyltransferase YjiC (YdhE family)